MGLMQFALSVCNDGNVAQLDCGDQEPGGVFYRIEVYRASQPSGGYGITLSGSRVEDICGKDHLTPSSSRVFRYTFSVGTNDQHRSTIPTLLEGREEFNPPSMPEGSWDVRIRDLDPASHSYGTILRATAAPDVNAGAYDIQYELRRPQGGGSSVAITSPLHRTIVALDPNLTDLGDPLDKQPTPVGLVGGRDLMALTASPKAFRLTSTNKTAEITTGLKDVLDLISHPDFAIFRKNLDRYEEFGDFGAKAVHPGTNLTGPNAKLAAESIFVRQYRAALVLLGRITSPDMADGAGDAKTMTLTRMRTNTRPGVYNIFVGAAVNHVAIYKLGLDKVHSDYGGVPMKIAPGSRLETGATPGADAWRCNQTLGEIANSFYLGDPPPQY